MSAAAELPKQEQPGDRCEHASGCKNAAAAEMRSPNGLRRSVCHEHVQGYLDSGWEMR